MYSGYDSADLFVLGQKSAITKSTVISSHGTEFPRFASVALASGSDWLILLSATYDWMK